MESFTERMINRTLKRSTAYEYYVCQQKHKNEERTGKGTEGPLIGEKDLKKSYELGTMKITPSDYESLPIRSPRSYRLGESFFNRDHELNMTDQCERKPKNTVLTMEKQDSLTSRRALEETPVKGSVEETTSSNSWRSNQGANFLSEDSPTPVLPPRNDAEELKYRTTGNSDKLTVNSNANFKPLDIPLKSLSYVAKQKHHGFGGTKIDVGENKKDPLNQKFFPATSDGISICKTNENVSKTAEQSNVNYNSALKGINPKCKEHVIVCIQNEEQKVQDYHGSTSITANPGASAYNSKSIQNGKEQEVQDRQGCTSVTASPAASAYNSECDTDDSIRKSHVIVESLASNITNIKALNKEDPILTYYSIHKMNLEKIDDKEDRLSQLDEVNVSAIKIEELNLPGLKLAQIVTEKSPLSFIHDLPQSSGLGRHSYSCPTQFNQRNSKESEEGFAVKAGGKLLNQTSGKGKFENNLQDSNKYSTKNLQDNYKIHANNTSEERKQNRKKNSCQTNRKNLEKATYKNTSEWDCKDSVSSGNYSAQSDSSVSIFSVHSSDISFSCPCSTSISQCSLPEEIPSDSLPYLLLQHLSLGRKVKNDSTKTESIRMNNCMGNQSTIVSGADDSYDDSNVARVNAHKEESELLKLQRKVAAETIVADQVSKALNVCYSSTVYNGSMEQVEGERLLLLSTIRKQAALNEVQHLRLQTTSNYDKNESIEVSIEDIQLLLRDDFMDVLIDTKQQDNFYFLCMISYQDTVLCTEAVAAKSGQPTIHFQEKKIKIVCEWFDVLRINFRVYMLRVKQKKIDKTKGKHPKRSSEVASKHDPYCFFSCGLVSSEKINDISKKVHEQLQTRVPGFVLIASVELHLPDDIDENYFILQEYKNSNIGGDVVQPLHEAAHLKINCSLSPRKLDAVAKTLIKYQGFLTRFVMINDIGAWQRGWWCIKGSYFMSWKYPEDEEKLPPLLVLDLKLCIEKISPISRLKCARSNTFSIKMRSELQSSLEGAASSQSLPARVPAPETFIEHILSADTRGERDDWCKNLNSTLILLQSWKFLNLVHID